MALIEKYQSLVDMAKQMGADNLTIEDAGDVLRISGTVSSEADKQRLWEEYNRIDPGMGSGDLTMDLAVAAPAEEIYTVERGDTLSEIGQRYGVPWREIFEANRDQLDDPDLIHPGQRLRIPRG